MTDTDTSAEARALIDTTRSIVRLSDGKHTHVRVTTGVLTDMADTLAALLARAESAEAERDRLRGAVRYWLHDDEVRDFGEWFEAGCKIARAALKETGHE
jgi:hypothetical protein